MCLMCIPICERFVVGSSNFQPVSARNLRELPAWNQVRYTCAGFWTGIGENDGAQLNSLPKNLAIFHEILRSSTEWNVSLSRHLSRMCEGQDAEADFHTSFCQSCVNEITIHVVSFTLFLDMSRQHHCDDAHKQSGRKILHANEHS
jgi:hypothetical protein